MTWPALYNRFPLLYPDSMTYLGDGRPVARALFLHKFSDYYGMRSFIYSLGILPWHWNVTAWPILLLQGLLTAYVIWLTARSLFPEITTLRYLGLIAVLSAVTSVSWFVSLIMPDILGPVLYLCIYLLVFAGETLSFAERATVSAIEWWGITSHATHFLLTVGLCVLLILLAAFFGPMRRRLKALGLVAAVLLLAAASQLRLHYYLYGEPSLNGERPPFLLARLIADGPGRWYLQSHCPQANLAICAHVDKLPDNADDFLWAPDGIWQSASSDDQKQLQEQEVPFVVATLKAYPGSQLSKSAANFWNQLITFDLNVFDANDWTLEVFDSVLPKERSNYLQSRQAHDALPKELFTAIAKWTVGASLIVIALFIPGLWQSRANPLFGLALVIVFSVVANALVTGTLSMVENRFQARVIWLVPLLACLLLLDWRNRRQRDKQTVVTAVPTVEPSSRVHASI